MINSNYHHLSPHERFVYIAEVEPELKGFKHAFARNCLGNIILNLFCCFTCRRKSELEQHWEDHRIYLMPPPSHDHPEYRAWERAARRVNEMVPYFQRIEIPPPVIRTVYMTRSTPSYVPPRREVVVVSAPLVPSVVFVPPPPPLPPVIVVNPPPRRRPKPVVVVQPPPIVIPRPRCPHPVPAKPRSNPQVMVNTDPDFRNSNEVKPTSHSHGRIQNLTRVNQAAARQLRH